MCDERLRIGLDRVFLSSDGMRFLTLRGPRRANVNGNAAAAGLALGPVYVEPALLTLGRLVSIDGS